jgi:hypothetical protein
MLVSLLSVRIAFDKLIAEIPSLSEYLAADAAIVHSPVFERAIVKLQSGETTLTRDEAAAVSMFKFTTGAPSRPAPNVPGQRVQISFEEEMRNEVNSKIAAKSKPPAYRSTFHISATSNIVERLFSRAGIIMSPRRRGMDPSTLEMLVMLRLNKDMWSAKTLQVIIDNMKAEARARKRERDLAAAAEQEREREEANVLSGGNDA